MSHKKILVTGAAGFIGSRLAAVLARRGDDVVGIDNINAYYDPRMKYGRLAASGIAMPQGLPRVTVRPATGSNAGTDVIVPDLPFGTTLQSTTLPRLRFRRLDITDRAALDALFAEEQFDEVVNLAAQAGVRYSIENPMAYVECNIVGFAHILECCRHHGVKHLVYASSSSVYGLNTKVPYSEDDSVDHPVSLYAASKKADELMAHAYGKLYGLPSTGLRYFTVYGPWGRPDMAPMLFARSITAGQPINVFNHGDLIRDFTYIDDIVEGTAQVLDHTPDAAACPHGVPARVYNIGCSNPVRLMDFISTLEHCLGREAQKNFLPMQPGDVYQTNADTSHLENEVGYKPHVTLADGLKAFAAWYRSGENPLGEIKSC